MDTCPHCGAELEMGYGLAGGGIGAYQYCPDHGIIDKWPDPELSTPEEMAKKRAAGIEIGEAPALSGKEE